MEKSYKEFYNIGNNRYYTLTADDELFIATSTFIKVARRFKFLKTEITQGLKLLKITTPIMILFDYLTSIKLLNNPKDTAEELLRYEQPAGDEIKMIVASAYNEARIEQEKMLLEWFNKMGEEVRKTLVEKDIFTEDEYDNRMTVFKNRYEISLQTIKKHDPLLNGQIDLNDPKGNKIIKGMIDSGISHLYTEPITGYMSNVYMYNIDMFAKLTVYRIITVKNVVQTIDTFIYDQKLIKKLMKHLEKLDKSKKERRK